MRDRKITIRRSSFFCQAFFCFSLVVPAVLSVSLPPSQQPPTSTVQFINGAKAAGVSFTHFKGNQGTSTILEEAGPGVCAFDYDNDGWQDIYFVNGRDLYNRGVRTRNALYRNNGDGTFTNVTKAAKIFQPGGKNLSVGASDFDHDGWPDLFVANDGVEFYLYRNNGISAGGGTFTDVAMTSGIALTADGLTMAAMCVSHGDYDNDGNLDLYISDFQAVPNRVFRNDGKGFYDEVSDAVGIAEPTRSVLSFGGGFFDYDNDGWLDLFIANGHVYPEVEQADQKVRFLIPLSGVSSAQPITIAGRARRREEGRFTTLMTLFT
jgi:hypothetical protein